MSRFDPEVSCEIQRLAVRGWPAEELEEVEGWLLRRTVGVDRRRSNSLLPPSDAGHAARSVELALATAEELGFDPVVQVAPAEVHRRLDADLEARSFRLSGSTLVLAGPLSPASSGGDGRMPPGSPDGAGRMPPPSGDRDAGGRLGRPAAMHGGGSSRSAAGARGVRLGPLTAEWLDAWAVISGIEGTVETGERVLGQLGDRACFATVVDPVSGDCAGTGIGVAEDGWLGLFSLAVAPSWRRRGVGSGIVDALSAWAGTRGARSVYLQVEADNAAALGIYARRGCFIAHSYHYRSA